MCSRVHLHIWVLARACARIFLIFLIFLILLIFLIIRLKMVEVPMGGGGKPGLARLV